MKKCLIILVFCIFFVISFSPPNSIADTRIGVGVYQNRPLLFKDTDGNVKGIFADILNYVAAKEGWTIEYRSESWAQCLKDLKSGKLDMLGAIAYSEQRNQIFDFTYENIISNWGQIYTGKLSNIESILDFKGKKIAVLQNDIYYKNLKELVKKLDIECRFTEAFDYETVLELVEVGKNDAGLVNYLYGHQYDRTYNINRSSIILSPQKIHFAVPKGKNKEIINTLDLYVRNLKKDKSSIYYQSLSRWIGVDSEPKDLIWIYGAGAGAVGLILLFLILNMVLRSQVRKRTQELNTKNQALINEIERRKTVELETRKLEKKLQQAQKMKAIGTLAGGVAHDLNNILSGIVSYPDLILMDLPENSSLIEPILTIQESGKKAAAIVQDLLTLARRGVSVSEVVNLSDIINEYLISPQLDKLKSYHPEVEIESNLDSALLNIMGSPVHLSKTVMNLVSNAVEAMPDGGKVDIKAENKYIDTPISGYEDVEEGDYVVLTVSDTGIGIASDEINRIFEPFYTKKIMGRSGTGLGMAVVWGTVKDHKGYIHVKSDEGKGTSIKLFFPVTRKPFSSNESPNSFESYRGDGESILVVDDVKEQRKIASKLLTNLGYSVQTVGSGKEAVEYLGSNPTDLIVLDMLMPPGIDGLETYEKIISRHPGQRAIIASGYSETNRVKKAQGLGAGIYVKKPYTLEKIGLAVRAELNKI